MLKKISSALLAGFLLAGASYAQSLQQQVAQAISDLKAVGGGAQYNNLTPQQKKQAIAMMLSTDENGNTDSNKASAIQGALADVSVDSNGDLNPASVASAISNDPVANTFVDAAAGGTGAGGGTPPPSSGNNSGGNNAGAGGPSSGGGPSGPAPGAGDGPAFGGDFGGGTVGGGTTDFSGALSTDQVNQTVRTNPEVVREILEEVGGSASLG